MTGPPSATGCGKTTWRRPAGAERDVPDERHLRDRRAFVFAAVAEERQAGGQDVAGPQLHVGLEIEAGCPHLLARLAEDVEAEHVDREERGIGRRGKLHRHVVAEQAILLLEVGGDRDALQPRRHVRERIGRRELVQIAPRQRDRLEKERLFEVWKADVRRMTPLVTDLQLLRWTHQRDRGQIDRRGARS